MKYQNRFIIAPLTSTGRPPAGHPASSSSHRFLSTAAYVPNRASVQPVPPPLWPRPASDTRGPCCMLNTSGGSNQVDGLKINPQSRNRRSWCILRLRQDQGLSTWQFNEDSNKALHTVASFRLWRGLLSSLVTRINSNQGNAFLTPLSHY